MTLQVLGQSSTEQSDQDTVNTGTNKHTLEVR
jgi:hypothetical protein